MKQIKVSFCSAFGGEDKFKLICEGLKVDYKRDHQFKKQYFGSNVPDVGYIIDADSLSSIKKLAKGNMWIENLTIYE